MDGGSISSPIVTFTHNLFPETHGAINGPNWSVALEMHFYLLAGLILPWLLKARPWLLAGIFVGIAWAWRFTVFRYMPCDPAAADVLQTCVYQRFFWTTKLPGTLDGFAVGILITRLFLNPRAAALMLRRRSLVVISLVFLVLAAVTLNIFWKRAEFWQYFGMVVFYKTLMSLMFGLLVLLACGVGRALSATVLGTTNYLGTISYGIYLWHLIVLLLLMRIPGLSKPDILFYTLLGTIVLSSLSWHAVRTAAAADSAEPDVTEGRSTARLRPETLPDQRAFVARRPVVQGRLPA